MDATGYSETQRAGARGRLTAGVLGLLLAWAVPGVLYAGEVQVAVAANFSAAAQEIGVLFAEATGHTVRFSFASSGQLYAQITQGAPFDVCAAAARWRPTAGSIGAWPAAASAAGAAGCGAAGSIARVSAEVSAAPLVASRQQRVSASTCTVTWKRSPGLPGSSPPVTGRGAPAGSPVDGSAARFAALRDGISG